MDTDLGRRVAAALAQARIARGWTQRDLARIAGVLQSAVARAERDAGASVDVLERRLRATEATVTVRTPAVEAPGRDDLVHRTGLRIRRRLHVRSQVSVATAQAVTEGSIRWWIDLLAYGPPARPTRRWRAKGATAGAGGVSGRSGSGRRS